MFRPPGLRARVITAFGLGALLVTTAFAALAYVLAHSYLTDATIARDQLETAGVTAGDVLSKLAPPTGSSVAMKWQGRWFASPLGAGQDLVPESIRAAVAEGNAVHQTRAG